MDDVKKLIVSLITSSNNLVGILGNKDCNDEASEEARKRLLFQLHLFVHGIRGKLNDLDELLWLIISSGLSDSIASVNPPETIFQHPGSCLRKNTASNKRTVSNAVYDRENLQKCSLVNPASRTLPPVPPNKSYQNNGNLYRRDDLTGESTQQMQEVRLKEKHSFNEKLRRRYEGYPYPENAVVVSPSDIFKQWKVFSLRFPQEIPKKDPQTLTEHQKQISTVEDTEYCTQAVNDSDNNNFLQTISSKSPLDSSLNESFTFTQTSRLSLGPFRRTPRSSPYNSLKAAEERQRAILAKPSLLASPRNIDFKNKKNNDLENNIKLKIKTEKPTRNKKTIGKTPTKKNRQVS